jgi:hypothetical protein
MRICIENGGPGNANPGQRAESLLRGWVFRVDFDIRRGGVEESELRDPKIGKETVKFW